MDHLILPSGSASEIFEYPGGTDYIGIPFLQYPVLANKSIYLQAQQGGSSRFRALWSGDDSQDETEFFATWLFCGLIQEVLAIVPQQLGETSLYRHEDFVCHRTDHHGQEIQEAFDTEKLVSLLEQWSILMGRHKEQCREQHGHLKQCMDMIYTLLFWKSVRIEQHVKTIIAVTAEILCFAIDSTLRDAVSDPECPQAWALFVENGEQRSSLIASGWCPSDASGVSSGNYPISQTLLFAYHLTRQERTGLYKSCPLYAVSALSSESEQHVNCTDTKCQALGGPGSPQKPQMGCTCQMFEFSDDLHNRLLNIINDEGIALLKFGNNSPGSCITDIVPCTESSKFVAISHVWSDGLGNPEQNAILQCRLDSILHLLSRSWKNAMDEDNADVLFWLDTMCCPLTPTEARKKVLRTMRTIYEKAEYVLVLDGELLNIAITNMTNLEIGWRILGSGWMSRLWTLQEGYLAKNLWVAFKDKTFLLDSLKDLDPRLSPLNQGHLWSRFKYSYWSLRKPLANQDTIGDQLWSLFWAAVRKRHVTKLTDEPLCLSTFFDLNTRAIIDAAPEDQMRMFWHLIGESSIEIPSGIIFHEQPRLAIDGYRWAPATFLNGSATAEWMLGSGDAKLTTDGLVLKVKAFSISRTSLSQAHVERSESPLMKVAKKLQLKALCYVRDQHGKWYSLIPRELIKNTTKYTSTHAPTPAPAPAPASTESQTKAETPSSSDNESFTRKTFPDPQSQYVIIQQKSTDLALLATTTHKKTDTDTNKNTNIISLFQHIVLTKDNSFQSIVFELARLEAHKIAQSEDFNPIDHDNDNKDDNNNAAVALTRVVEQGARNAALELGKLQRQGNSEAMLPPSFDEHKTVMLMATNIVLMLTDQHHVDAVSLPDDHEWCVT